MKRRNFIKNSTFTYGSFILLEGMLSTDGAFGSDSTLGPCQTNFGLIGLSSATVIFSEDVKNALATDFANDIKNDKDTTDNESLAGKGTEASKAALTAAIDAMVGSYIYDTKGKCAYACTETVKDEVSTKTGTVSGPTMVRTTGETNLPNMTPVEVGTDNDWKSNIEKVEMTIAGGTVSMSYSQVGLDAASGATSDATVGCVTEYTRSVGGTQQISVTLSVEIKYFFKGNPNTNPPTPAPAPLASTFSVSCVNVDGANDVIPTTGPKPPPPKK